MGEPTGKGRSTGHHPWFWGGLMLLAMGGIAVLAITDAIEGPALLILMVLVPGGLMIPTFRAATRMVDDGDCHATKGVAQRRYLRRIAIFTSAYLIAMAGMVWASNEEGVSQGLRALLAIPPALGVIGVFWAIGRLMVEEQDEFIRMLVIRQSLIATGLSLSAAALWGFLETAQVVPHLDAFWWPVLWFVGLAIGAVSNRIQYGAWGAV